MLIVGGGDVTLGDGAWHSSYDQPPLTTAWIYNPATSGPATFGCTPGPAGCWTAAQPPHTPRFMNTATLLDGPACRGASPPPYCGRVLVAGGGFNVASNLPPTSTAELFDPTAPSGASQWTTVTSMIAGRYDHTAILLDGSECHRASPPTYCGKVLVAAGAGDAGLDSNHQQLVAPSTSVELYDPADGDLGKWSATGSLAVRRYDHAATLLDPGSCATGTAPTGYPCGEVLVEGGISTAYGQGISSAEVYSPTTGAWLAAGSLHEQRTGQTANLLADGRVLVAGSGERAVLSIPDNGNYNPVLSSAELYDPVAKEWAFTGSMAGPRTDAATTVLDGPACRAAGPSTYCGQVLTVGGEVRVNQPSDFLDTAELYRETPAISGLSPAGGASSGGTRVVVTGSGFTPSTAVTFGGVPAAVTVESSNQLTAVAPPHAGGGVEVAVTDGVLTSATIPPRVVDYFLYDGCARLRDRGSWPIPPAIR